MKREFFFKPQSGIRNPRRGFRALVNAQANEAEIMIYDTIGQTWDGEGITAKAVKAQLDSAVAQKMTRMVMRINSPGGDVFEGAAIYNLVKQCAIPVDVIIDGLAASAAFTIAMAGRKCSIGEAAMMMLHNAWSFAIGDANELRAVADRLEKVSSSMCDIYAKRAGMDCAAVQSMMDAETWMKADECVNQGFADEVIGEPADTEDGAAAAAAMFDLASFGFEKLPENLKNAKKSQVSPENSPENKPNPDQSQGSGESPAATTPVATWRRRIDLAERA